MMLTHENFRVTHVSAHVSLREACDRVKKDRIIRVIDLTYEALKKLGVSTPKIAVAGLNPLCPSATPAIEVHESSSDRPV